MHKCSRDLAGPRIQFQDQLSLGQRCGLSCLRRETSLPLDGVLKYMYALLIRSVSVADIVSYTAPPSISTMLSCNKPASPCQIKPSFLPPGVYICTNSPNQSCTTSYHTQLLQNSKKFAIPSSQIVPCTHLLTRSPPIVPIHLRRLAHPLVQIPPSPPYPP